MNEQVVVGSRERMDQLLKVMELIAAGDFSTRFPPSDSHDEIDALGAGVNMLVEEIQAKVVELERMNKLFVDRELAMRDLKEKVRVLEQKLKDHNIS